MMPAPSFKALFLGSCLLAMPAFAADNDDELTENSRGDRFFGLGWLDQTQSFASISANNIASQMDSFFGEPRSDQEAAYSSLRLTLEQGWYRLNGSDTGVRLRGRVYLPRIEERLSLIFSEDQGDGSSYYQSPDAAGTRVRETRPSLEFNLSEREGHRLDFRVGLSSSLKGKISTRYRYEAPVGDHFSNFFAQTLSFADGIGFSTITRYQANYLLEDDVLLRWNNDLRFSEDYKGARWSTQPVYARRVSDRTARLYYFRVSGETRPSFVSSYDIGFRWRQNVARPWLFIEIEPGHGWTKLGPDESRRSNPFIYLRVEMAFGRL